MTRFQEQNIIQLCLEKLSDMEGTSVQFRGSKSIGGGCINHALKMSTSAGDYFLKWNDSAKADLFTKEAAGLDELRMAESSIIIPKVLWSKEVDETPGLLLMEYLPAAISTSGFEEQLGRGLAQLHRKTASAFGFHQANYCGTTVQDNTWTDNWPEFFAERRIWALVEQLKIKRQLPATEILVYEKLVLRMSLLLPHHTIPALIHGDLWSGNYLYTANGPALIDPACCYADRELELGMMLLFGGFPKGVWDSYQEEYPLPEGWLKRNSLYQLYHILNHYLLFGGSYGQQALHIAKDFI